jgi:hypothetical protein
MAQIVLQGNHDLNCINDDFNGLRLQMEPRHADPKLSHGASLHVDRKGCRSNRLRSQHETIEDDVACKNREAQLLARQVLEVAVEDWMQRRLEPGREQSLHGNGVNGVEL